MVECGKKTEVYSRVCGYHRPIANWNKGKKEEFVHRRVFDIEKSEKSEFGNKLVID
ncbi:MAG: anaerobic ribonucleoside-triphosphate reductase [Nanoarchaeota archaeon]|nr:anaerobic ribonucleoside-triphosphate reductase [Nanoarchaeota archaeon]